MTRTFRFVSLGCAKNLVDSETMVFSLIQSGWRAVAEGPADLVVVNTCAFIEDAVQESVDTLLAEAEAKRRGETHWLAVVGCLPEKYREKLAQALPEADLVAGVGAFAHLDHLVEETVSRGKRRISLPPPRKYYPHDLARVLSTPPYRAYLKVAEGCSNACAYCLIGRFRGPFRSRMAAAIVSEARDLVSHGVLEIDLIAQDLTQYGGDLTPAVSLNELLRQLDDVADLRWLRLLYAHPARVDRELAETLAGARRIVPYLDIPLQHFSDRVLALMNRPQTRKTSEQVVSLLRRLVPDIALRTTFLLGHPGETDDDVEQLLEFMRRSRFEHVGAFVWSPEKGTASYDLPDRVDPEVAELRRDRVLGLQQEIGREVWREKIGLTVEVLVEEVLHKHDEQAYTHVGRIPQQAPEADGVTYLRAPSEDTCRVGQIVRARVVDADVYDLFAELV